MEDSKYYIIIAGNKIRHTTGGVDSALIWAKKYPHAVILECNTVPLEPKKKIVACEDPKPCLRGCHVHDQTCKHPIYEQ